MILLAAILLFANPQTKKDYHILFTKIDNAAKVYVNDSLIYQSGIVDWNPELSIKVDLNQYLKKGKNKIKVILINGSGEGTYSHDANWEIFYEIMENNIPIDFGNDKSSEGDIGIVYTMVHEIYIE